MRSKLWKETKKFFEIIFCEFAFFPKMKINIFTKPKKCNTLLSAPEKEGAPSLLLYQFKRVQRLSFLTGALNSQGNLICLWKRKDKAFLSNGRQPKISCTSLQPCNSVRAFYIKVVILSSVTRSCWHFDISIVSIGQATSVVVIDVYQIDRYGNESRNVNIGNSYTNQYTHA